MDNVLPAGQSSAPCRATNQHERASRERLNIVYVMSREQQDVDLFNGRITREKCDQLFERWISVADHDAAYV